FKSLIHQGMILGPDGQKMSKSKGNVVSPDEYVQQYGADAFRCSLMFGFAYELGGPWDDGAIGAVNRFIKRLIRMVEESAKTSYKPIRYELLNADEKQLLRTLHNSIKLITDDLERLQFNTSISRLMEIVNEYYRFISLKNHSDSTDDLLAYSAEMLVRLFAPFAPHISEELWESLGKSESVFLEKWPAHNEYYLEIDQVNYVLQINGKIRAELLINKEASNNEIERIAMSNQRIIDLTQGKTIRKVIIVPKRLVNIVVS
ncbi:MAG: class I tRNA ligase family protein, partial [Calditrichaeota bacterium]|nr:class I tRNA ligase family protein [Calditrichota bacterium]